MQPKTEFVRILRTLSKSGVDFIVVGGMGAVLQGAPIATFDLDVVHSRTPENVERLMRALELMETRYRAQAGRILRPTLDHLASEGHQLLIETKEEAGRDKDKAVLAILRRTLEEKRK